MLEETVVTVVLVVILVEEMYAWRIAKLDINTKIKLVLQKIIPTQKIQKNIHKSSEKKKEEGEKRKRNTENTSF